MYKICIAERRAPGLDVASFQVRWQQAYQQTVTHDPVIQRCTLNLPLPQGYRKKDLVYDGFAELWFEEEDAYERWSVSTARALLDDTLNGVCTREDRVEYPVVVRVIKDGAAGPGSLKIVEFINRRPDMPFAAFHRYWWHDHGPLAAAIPQLERYEQNQLLGANYAGAEPRFDGFAITWFRSTSDMRASAQTVEFGRAAEDEPNFLAREAVEFIICTERTAKA